MDELDIPNIKKDQEVKVTVTALPDKTYTGKVKEIAEQGQVQNGVSSFSVIISLDKTDDLKAGMTADASILVNEKKMHYTFQLKLFKKTVTTNITY